MTVAIPYPLILATRRDLDSAVAGVETHLGLSPFLRFELLARHGSPIPIALFSLEGGSLEVLGRVDGCRPETGVISCVEMVAPVAKCAELARRPMRFRETDEQRGGPR